MSTTLRAWPITVTCAGRCGFNSSKLKHFSLERRNKLQYVGELGQIAGIPQFCATSLRSTSTTSTSQLPSLEKKFWTNSDLLKSYSVHSHHALAGTPIFGVKKVQFSPRFQIRSKIESTNLSANMKSITSSSGFFTDASNLIENNFPQLYYGICAADMDGDGQLEFFVCGFGTENLLLKWTGDRLQNVAVGTNLADPLRQSIGVAAADLDGDGLEELYVLNTDTFGGRKRLTDRLFDKQGDSYVDLFSLPQNMDDANMFAGRSVCAVDRKGTGRYGFFVANYGGAMKLYELSEDGFLGDTAGDAGLVMYPTGGRSLLSLPLVSHTAMDIFAGNENGPNFLFVNKGDGSGKFVESAAAYGLMDPTQHCRGIAPVADVAGSGELGLVVGNWEGPHRLFAKSGPGPRGGAAMLGFRDVGPELGGFRDTAPPAMAAPSRVRTVISADFDNDGREEIFFNNIGQPNRLFRQLEDGEWVPVDIGDALEPRGLGTGAAVADIDNDGRLELIVAHGESGMQPLTLYRPPANDNAWIRLQPLTQQGAPARGASVQLRDQSGRWQKRVIDAGSGYLCCMEPVAHFGLGQNKGPVFVRILWPDGSAADLPELLPFSFHTVKHPSTVPNVSLT